MIPPILQAAQALASPLIVQISQKDMTRCGVRVEAFAEAFYTCLSELKTTVPVVLHLDHTEEVSIIKEAIAAGFTSVMIDASDKPLEENIALTHKVVAYGHARGVSVEGELGTIGAFSFSETDASEAVNYTDPAQVERFVRETGVDVLAVSVGTMHGVNANKPIMLDIARLRAVRERTDVHLVLHGGSGIGAEAMARAIRIPGGGVSKVNLATDLELAMLGAIGSEARLVNTQIEALSKGVLERARAAVEQATRDKIRHILLSEGRAHHYLAQDTVLENTATGVSES